MTTYVPTSVESEAKRMEEEARERGQPVPSMRRPPPAAFAFASGFMLGTLVSSILGRVRQRPFVAGNRNVFVSLPFSGISMVAPAVRARGRRQRPRFGRWSRGMARSMTRGAASGMVRGMARRRQRAR